ncbi:MAG: helix-turn-helix transcriptional regulator [Bacteroidales bacterium]|nr:helix-turn-helix transcriptional regulator [Bacteroidales bacterium]MDY3912517.1 helix-turn-helix transcriptional regulator [Sodaliphilus sp.]
MDIVSRLKHFLETNGITNSLFADTCGIARPTLSQLLNGRNRRVSDEILAKIHKAYPTLNIMWLMFGDGNMIGPNANTANSDTLPSTGVDFAAQAGADGSIEEPNSRATQSIMFDEPESDAVPADATQGEAKEPVREAAPAASLSAALQDLARRGGQMPRPATPPADGRRIVSIMVFYNDNSFETFTPQS